jgi:Zn-finger nucleic acid-binding protein
MKCPVDGATLAMTERSGVEIDYCPECRGVWLDRGELDNLIAAGSSQRGDYDERQYPSSHDDHRDERHDDRREDQHSGDQQRPDQKRRRGSFLEDVFGGFGD